MELADAESEAALLAEKAGYIYIYTKCIKMLTSSPSPDSTWESATDMMKAA